MTAWNPPLRSDIGRYAATFKGSAQKTALDAALHVSAHCLCAIVFGHEGIFTCSGLSEGDVWHSSHPTAPQNASLKLHVEAAVISFAGQVMEAHIQHITDSCDVFGRAKTDLETAMSPLNKATEELSRLATALNYKMDLEIARAQLQIACHQYAIHLVAKYLPVIELMAIEMLREYAGQDHVLMFWDGPRRKWIEQEILDLDVASNRRPEMSYVKPCPGVARCAKPLIAENGKPTPAAIIEAARLGHTRQLQGFLVERNCARYPLKGPPCRFDWSHPLGITNKGPFEFDFSDWDFS